MANELCIYMTGLPGAGKSTICKYLSERLSIPMLDKDDYLEALFESRGIGDTKWRHKLSREADLVFRNEAASLDKVILVSHWRPKDTLVDYGTSGEWLVNTFKNLIEVHCDSPVSVATDRYINRTRHKGHLDESKSDVVIESWLSDYAAHLPIGFGRCISTNSANESWKDDIENKFLQFL